MERHNPSPLLRAVVIFGLISSPRRKHIPSTSTVLNRLGNQPFSNALQSCSHRAISQRAYYCNYLMISRSSTILHQLTHDERTSSPANMNSFATGGLYILGSIGILLLLVLVPSSSQPQVSWDACLDTYGPALKSTHARRAAVRSSVRDVVRERVVKSFGSLYVRPYPR